MVKWEVDRVEKYENLRSYKRETESLFLKVSRRAAREVLRFDNFLSTKANNAGQVWQLHGPFSISRHEQPGEEIFW